MPAIYAQDEFTAAAWAASLKSLARVLRILVEAVHPGTMAEVRRSGSPPAILMPDRPWGRDTVLRFPLRAHAEWITLLREALYGHGDLDVESAADDQSCELGRWLNQWETEYGGLSEYRELAEVHTRFHHRAAYCLALANAGRRSDALAELEGTGRLRSLSGLLVGNLQRLRAALATTKGPALPAN